MGDFLSLILTQISSLKFPHFESGWVYQRLCYGFFVATLLFSALLTLTESGHSIESSAKQVYLVDVTTGAVLYEKNADEPMIPSSMSKILTAFVIFEQLKHGTLSLGTRFPVSKAAWSKGGSKMFVKLHDNVSVEELLKGAIVQSGNDACIVLAEGVAGSEESFATIMNERAKELGALNSNFVNATGWPDEAQYSTAKDLAILAERTIETFPEFYRQFYTLKEFTHNKIRQPNRNGLLFRTDLNCDGLKTGKTENGGLGVVASVVQGGRRLIAVVNGHRSEKERTLDTARLFKWGFASFVSPRIFRASEPVDYMDVWMGQKDRLKVGVEKDVAITLPKKDLRGLKVKLQMDTPVEAPIQMGQSVGKIIVEVPGEETPRETPLIALESVERVGFLKGITKAIHFLLFGYHQSNPDVGNGGNVRTRTARHMPT